MYSYHAATVNHFSAIVLPIACTLGSLGGFGAKNPTLLRVTELQTPYSGKPSRDAVLRLLLAQVEQTIGEILNIEQDGTFHLSTLSLPEGYNR